jgi:hypothetical protein
MKESAQRRLCKEVNSSDRFKIRTVKKPDINDATTKPFDTSHSVPTTQVMVHSASLWESLFGSSSVRIT